MKYRSGDSNMGSTRKKGSDQLALKRSGNHLRVMHSHHKVQVVWPHLTQADRAMVRSQSGPLSSVPFTAMLVDWMSRIDAEHFGVLLVRRLRMPLLAVFSKWPPPRSVRQSRGVG